MKISWIKQEDDNRNFAIAERLGLGVYRLSNPEEVDKKMEELINNQNCKNIVLSNEIAGFSEDIIKKYRTDKRVNIYISPRK